jgi:hypothetical protein
MLIHRMTSIRIVFTLALFSLAVGLSQGNPGQPERAESQKPAAAIVAAKARALDGTPLPAGPAQPLQGLVDASYEQCVTICEGLADGCRATGGRKGDCAAIYLGCVRRCAARHAK